MEDVAMAMSGIISLRELLMPGSRSNWGEEHAYID